MDYIEIIKELDAISKIVYEYVNAKNPCHKGDLNASVQGYIHSIKNKIQSKT